ncbi:hypothetical protein M3936_03750 [Sutcliffiella horikoshii]|uniref:hypothetical protein n=1 Tax=Sutcliffiella horikoshii TaxID=79883 RepID=UPI00203E4068|nr:hypothetical protein [Sutcliffiella horikoshii]MCM3616691.1 hypothetical protein [Sutcliffiella horikoshii]
MKLRDKFFIEDDDGKILLVMITRNSHHSKCYLGQGNNGWLEWSDSITIEELLSNIKNGIYKIINDEDGFMKI